MKESRFWLITLCVALTLIAIVDSPILSGKVPFPSFLLFVFPSLSAAGPPGPLQVPANIGDLATFFYPFRTMVARAIHGGEVPLWNPYMLAGTPLLASAQSAIFYPLTVPYYLLPIHVAWTISFILGLLLVMLFTAALVRHIGGTITGSIVAAVLLAFCGFLTAWQGSAMHDTAIWLPLICLGIVRLHSVPSRKNLLLCAFSFSMPVLAGHPETAAHVTLTALALAAYLAVTKPNRIFVFHFLAAGVLSVGLAAVQALPTVEWLNYAYHSFVDRWPPQPLWSAAGWVSRDVLHSTSSSGLEIPEMAAYMGMLVFLAAPLAFLHRSRQLVWFFFGWTVIVLSVAYGVGPFFWLANHTPMIKAIKNARFIYVGAFGLAVLAGLGISAIENWSVVELQKSRVRAGLLIASGFSIAATLIYFLRVMTTALSEPSRFPRVSAAILLISTVPFILRLMGKVNGRAFAAAALVIVSVDQVSFARGYMPFTDKAYIFPPVELFDRIPKNGNEPFRLAQINAVYTENAQLMYGLDSIGGFEVCLARIKEFLYDLTVNDMSAVAFEGKSVLAAKDRRLDMLNTKYFIVSQWDPDYRGFHEQTDRFRFLYSVKETDVFENLQVLPAAFMVPSVNAEVIAEPRRSVDHIRDPAFDPRRSVVIEEPLAHPGVQDSFVSNVQPAIKWVSRRSNSFELNVTVPMQSVLVVSQTYYPGWVALVDGDKTAVRPVDFALTGIEIPRGNHQVQFVFQPRSFRIGLLVSVAAVLVFIGLAVDSLRYRFKPSDSRSA